MNFLAHAFLSGDDPELLAGNFMGDFIKGKHFGNYPSGIAKGVVLHREIDFFTDNHIDFEKSKARLRPRFGLYSAVIVDIFYDHFLNINWTRYSDQDKGEFIQSVYTTVERYFDLAPSRFQIVFPNIKAYNWLLHYGRIEGVERSLAGMSRRSKFKPELERAVEELKLHYHAYDDDFNSFFPEAIRFVRDYLECNEKSN